MKLIKSFIVLLFSISGLALADDASISQEMENIFTGMHERNLKSSRPEGSLLQNTQPYVDFLQAFIKENAIRSVVEVGCGDWSISRYIPWGDIQYHGYDVVKNVVEQNKKKYGRANVQFTHADALSSDLPSADLLICKDVLQHLSNEEIIHFLAKTDKFKHCLITNDINRVDKTVEHNTPIQTGKYRPLDLSHKPFKANGIKLLTYASGSTIKQVFYIKNSENNTTTAKETKKVLIAILAKNKAHTLPKYLAGIENLDYDKKLIALYIRTNNNSDDTQKILSEWVKRLKSEYLDIIFEDEDVSNAVASHPHHWPNERMKLLAGIRNRSMEKAKEYKTDFYLVADCDNFLLPHTLKYLIHKDKPIIAPMLRSIPRKDDRYSNYFCEIDDNGYYKSDSDYYKILNCSLIGTFKVPLVHCTYLIKTEYLDRLNYLDETNAMEFVIFARGARKNGIDQYICNEREFGTLYHPYSYDISLENEIKDYQKFLEQ